MQSTQEIISTAIFPTELEGGPGEVLSTNKIGFDKINPTTQLAPENSYFSFGDTLKLGNEIIVKHQNDREVPILPNARLCSQYTSPSNNTMGNEYLSMLPSEITSGKNNCSIVSENEQENEYEVITIAQNINRPRQIAQSGMSLPVQTYTRNMNNRKMVTIGVTIGLLITILSVTLVAVTVQLKSTASSDAKYKMETNRGNSLIMTESTIPSSKFIGITARSRPARKPLSFITSTLDLSNVIINNGVKEHIAGKITCPVDGVYFLSVSVMSSGKGHDWIEIRVSTNFKKIITFGMGFSSMDYAADEHAFINCKKGDEVKVRYNYYGLPEKRLTPKASITLMLMAPPVKSVIGFYARQSDQMICKIKPEMTFDTTMFNLTLFEENKFTCPVKGIYLVMASYVTHQNQATVSIVNNKQPIMSLTFTQTTRTGFLDEDLTSSASNIVIVKCMAKEKLLVKKIAGPNKCKSHHKARMMFSAILLHRDGDEKTFVGVSAWKKSVQEYRLNDTIIFDSVLLNEGGYFDTNKNRFFCSHNGFYYTALTVRKEKGYPVRLSLQLENESVFKINHIYHKQPYGMMSSSSLLHCKKGEEIYVMGTGHGVIYGSEKLVITTVTIILMHEN